MGMARRHFPMTGGHNNSGERFLIEHRCMAVFKQFLLGGQTIGPYFSPWKHGKNE